MSEKLLDFGTFGKWSKSTLIAQHTLSGIGYWAPPECCIDKKKRLEDMKYKIKKQELKKMSVEALCDALEDLKGIEKDLQDYERLRETIRVLEEKVKK